MPLTANEARRIPRLYTPTLGSDPELFIAMDNKVVGAEKVIPKNGIGGKIVLDGVQVELHPSPQTCRALIANDFKAIFKNLKTTLDQKGAKASFDPVVKMSKEELKSLSQAAQQLGCQPSKNVADPTASIKVPKNFRTRSAGGHIHIQLLPGIGCHRYPEYTMAIEPKNVQTFIKVLDCMLGLPSVLIDRDPSAAERRKVYGRASEHRDHTQGAAGGAGVEYRVLSNYWLRSYQLMSFVHGMARQSTNIYMAQFERYNPTRAWDAPGELLKRVDINKVWEAINKNNYALALKQWAGVENFIDEFCTDSTSGLWSGQSLSNFRFFAEQVKEHGIQKWFPEEPMEHWCNIPEGHQFNDDGFAGWESFILNLVTGVKADHDIDTILTKLRSVA